METILIQVDHLLGMTKTMVVKDPSDPVIKAMCNTLEELKAELSKPNSSDKKIKQLTYGITRVFDDMRYLENTQFGLKLGELLTALNQLY